MHSKINNIKIMINEEAAKVIESAFESLKNRYEKYLELLGGSAFVFDYIHLLYYKWHKINPNCGGPYIYFPDWIKNKNSRTNPINKTDNKCF